MEIVSHTATDRLWLVERHDAFEIDEVTSIVVIGKDVTEIMNQCDNSDLWILNNHNTHLLNMEELLGLLTVSELGVFTGDKDKYKFKGIGNIVHVQVFYMYIH